MVATFKADKADLPTPVQAKKLKEEFDKHTIYLLTEVRRLETPKFGGNGRQILTASGRRRM